MIDDVVPVVENRPLTGGHFLLSVQSPRQAQATRAGQFAMVRLLDRSDVLLRRPMSIYDVKPAVARGRNVAPPFMAAGAKLRLSASRAEAGLPIASGRVPPGPTVATIIQLLYKVVGRGTHLMAELKPGDKVGLIAPLGHGFFVEEYLDAAQRADAVLHVAGGIGIAALLLPARDLARGGIRQRLFFGGRTKEDLVGLEEFKPLVKSIDVATENGSRGYRGYVTQRLETFLERNRSKKYLLMVCGPWGMLEASVRLAKRFDHPCLLSMENRMGCGLGVCLGCCIRVVGEGHNAYQRVCTEGPVFWAERVVFESTDCAD